MKKNLLVLNIIIFILILSGCNDDKNISQNIINIDIPKNVENNINNADCLIETGIDIVQGTSMAGTIENGDTVTSLYGYYKCNDVKRNDVVLVHYAGNKNPLIKMVKGISGDRFEIKPIDHQNTYQIFINGTIVKNANRLEYVLDERAYKMLYLYEKDFKNIIPPNTYLILGNQIHGTIDSTRFGLVSKDALLAKVEVDR